MAYNDQPHDIQRDNYGYAERVAQIAKDTKPYSGNCRYAGIACSLRVSPARVSLPLAVTPISR